MRLEEKILIWCHECPINICWIQQRGNNDYSEKEDTVEQSKRTWLGCIQNNERWKGLKTSNIEEYVKFYKREMTQQLEQEWDLKIFWGVLFLRLSKWESAWTLKGLI